jgi:hypothetical protein
VFLSVVFLCAVSFVPSLHAEANTPTTDESVGSESNLSQASEDPNVVSENAVTETGDPNELLEEDGAFTPRISTYLEIIELFGEILNPELITDQGLVDYDTLRRKRQDMVRVSSKLKELNPAVRMALNKNEKQAFWINTFNVCVLELVIEHYPIEPKLYMIFYPDSSIMQITGNWWTKEYFDIQTMQYTLQEIEWNFLLNPYKDPRIIFALSYASLGGAILQNEPYTAEELDRQLDDQVRQYLQTPQGMKIDKEKNILYLSNLFTMHDHRELFLASEYAEIKRFRDRNPDEQAWLNFIWHYVSEEDKRYLENASPDIRFMKYDWQLNEAP